MESPIFICGMPPLDSDDPIYDIIHCDPSLNCNTHIEVEKKERKKEIPYKEGNMKDIGSH
jgi:hypothetical protein